MGGERRNAGRGEQAVPPSAPEIVWLMGELASRGLSAAESAKPAVAEPSSNPGKSGDGGTQATSTKAPAETPETSGARDPLRAYLRYVARQPRMSREDEAAAGRRIEEGERAVLDAIVQSPLAAIEVPELAGGLVELSDDEVGRIVERLAIIERALDRAESELRDLPRRRGDVQEAATDPELLEVTGRRDRAVAIVEGQARMGAPELRALGRAVRLGEEQVARAKADLVQAHLRQVVWIARRYADRGVPLLDLIQEGNIGLMTAANKFDYRLGHRFATYAAWWIRQAVSRALGEQSRTIRLPVHTNEALARVNRSRRRLSQRFEREPTPAEIAEDVGVPTERVEAILQWARNIVSLETPVGEEESGVLEDLVANPNAELPSAAAMASELSQRTRAEMAVLSPREQEILSLRFGIGRDHEMTLEEIGERFGLTRERIRQIEARALSKLRHPARARALKGFVEG